VLNRSVPATAPDFPGAPPLRRRLAVLPRDSRDTLFLLAVVAAVLAPLAGTLPGWASALAAVVLAWRATLAWQAKPLPGRIWRVALLAAAVAGTAATHGGFLGREAGVTLVAMLLALKTLELRARRDALVVFFLGFFTMLTGFFFSQSLLAAAAAAAGLFGLLTALVNAHLPVGRPPLAVPARIAAKLMLWGLPTMAVLFMLFPRMSPLWGQPTESPSGRSGLSSRMEVGAIARLALDDGIAMRIRFDAPDGAAPEARDLYFRGPVLSRFDGREWSAAPAFGLRSPDRWRAAAGLEALGPGIAYRITLEPHRQPWLYVLDAAVEPPDELPEGMVALPTADLQWLASRPVSGVIRYRVRSHTDYRYGAGQASAAMREFTALPPAGDPRTRQLAAELRRTVPQAADDPMALVGAALERLRTGGYRYTLEPGVYGADTADEFWFDRKEGFCEHIASAFVVLMRAAGVPARIVTGYQGGERNPVDGGWVVRQRDAHAWAEIWQSGRGWSRVDPTASVAPDRIGLFQRLPVPQGFFGATFDAAAPGLAQHLQAVWEAANDRWNQWVLNYTQGRQMDLLRRLGFSTPDWHDLAAVLGGLLAIAAFCGAGWAAWQRRQQDPWLRLLDRARSRLAQAGLDSGPARPPRALAEALGRSSAAGDGDGSLGRWRRWLLRMEAVRYAPESPPGALARLRREYRRLPRLDPIE
jgi:transglutaminase-like putative cysteine protease